MIERDAQGPEFRPGDLVRMFKSANPDLLTGKESYFHERPMLVLCVNYGIEDDVITLENGRTNWFDPTWLKCIRRRDK